MQLGDLLSKDRIHVPLRARTIAEGLGLLLREFGMEPQEAARAADALLAGEEGELLHPSSTTALALLPTEDGEPAAALGVAPEALAAPNGSPRALLLLRVAPPLTASGDEISRLSEVIGTPAVEERVLSAANAEEVRGIRRLMGVTLSGTPKVRDALTPLSYRIYPDTPLDEVVDLMARKELAAVPVVGEGLQVLGVISAGEALKQALQGVRKAGPEAPRVSARDVMSRSIMCVTEDQDLDDAAQIMVSRDVAQLPVVREGEIVGFLTRAAVLRALFGTRS